MLQQKNHAPKQTTILLIVLLFLGSLGGITAWLQTQRALTTNLPNATTYYPLPGQPENFDMIIQQLEQVDMYAVAMQHVQLEEWLLQLGPKVVMEEMYKDRFASARTDCHTAAHLIGHASFALFGLAAFGAGNELCHSGYNHGVIESYIDAVGTEGVTEKLQVVCGSVADTFGQLQCFHGAGHGIMAYLRNDLPVALQLCKSIPHDRNRQSCYSGVFMENMVSAIDTEEVSNHPTRWVNDDPYYPCTSVDKDEQIQKACYKMQTTWLFALFQNDNAKVIAACNNAPSAYVAECFQSFGRDLAGTARLEPKSIIHGCNAITLAENTTQCFRGAVHAIIDFYGPNLGNEANDFCHSVDANQRTQCEASLEERLHVIKTQ